MSYLIKNLHFIVIHVPIAMLLFSFIFDVLALFLKKKEWHSAGLLCLIVGTLGAIAAVITGPEDRNPLKEMHEHFGDITMVFFIILTAIRAGFLALRKREIGSNLVYLAAALIGVVLVSYTGHLGGEMVHPDRSKIQQQFRNGGGGGQRAPGSFERGPNQQDQQSPQNGQDQQAKPSDGASAQS